MKKLQRTANLSSSVYSLLSKLMLAQQPVQQVEIGHRFGVKLWALSGMWLPLVHHWMKEVKLWGQDVYPLTHWSRGI